MTARSSNQLSRRQLLKAMTLVPPAITLAACANQAAPTSVAIAPESEETVVVEIIFATPAATATSTLAPTNAPVETPTVEEPTIEPSVTPAVAAQALPPTPACDDGDEPTPQQTEGPYYTPNTPQRSSFIEAGLTGTPMVVSGFVLTSDCRPVARAMLDFWHCDGNGVYDNSGYTLRGHFFSDEAGRYSLETIMPGLYLGRTRHFHVKVQAPNQPVLTTQLYFPNEPANARDGIYRKECEMFVQDNANGSKIGAFNFVLKI